jgi:hypothetical protein
MHFSALHPAAAGEFRKVFYARQRAGQSHYPPISSESFW